MACGGGWCGAGGGVGSGGAQFFFAIRSWTAFSHRSGLGYVIEGESLFVDLSVFFLSFRIGCECLPPLLRIPLYATQKELNRMYKSFYFFDTQVFFVAPYTGSLACHETRNNGIGFFPPSIQGLRMEIVFAIHLRTARAQEVEYLVQLIVKIFILHNRFNS